MMKYYTSIFAWLSFVSICNTTLLWRINVNPPAYLLGTIHLPYTYLWPSLSDTAKSAFSNSTHFLPEFDMTNFFTFTRFRMCLNSQILADGNGPPPLPSGFISQHQQEPPILDVYLTLEARRLRKTIISLESVEMYCEFTKFQADSLSINLTSGGAKPPSLDEKDYEKIRSIYNCDFNYPGELFPPSPAYIPDKTLLEFKQRLEKIVERRDSETSQKIDNLLKEGSPDNRFFIAVGYIHLLGSNGIIAKLRRDYKYSITRLCTDPLESRAALKCLGPSWCYPIPGL